MNTWYNIKLDKLSINLEESVSGPMGLSGSCIWSWVWPNGRHIARAKRTSSSTGEWILSGPALQQLHPKTQSQTNVFDYNRDYCYGSKQLCCNTNQLIHNVVVCRRWERPARTPVCRTLQSMKPHPPMIPRAPGWSCSVSDSEVHSANHLRERSTVHYKRPSLLTEFKINCKENTSNHDSHLDLFNRTDLLWLNVWNHSNGINYNFLVEIKKMSSHLTYNILRYI